MRTCTTSRPAVTVRAWPRSRAALSALPFEWGVPGHQMPLTRQEVFDELAALENDDILQLP